MALLSARRSACVLSAVAATALMAPSLASAKKTPPPEQCSGVTTLEGKGSTLQNNAQQKVWTQDFSTSLNGTACNGKNVGDESISVVYNATGVEGGTGSVQGMEAFGLNGQTSKVKKFNYVGTDEPPNEEQLKEMETANNGTKIESIPVLQASVAILVHLPKGCTAENTTDSEAIGRFVFTNATLGKIFQGELKSWKSILEAEKTAGDTIKGKSPAEQKECEEDEFKVIVRKDGSGTTHIVKRYLGLIEPRNTPFELEEGVAGEKSGAVYTWSGTNDIDQGNLNTAWPKALNKERECNDTCEGGGELAHWVSTTENTIGYANLSDARGHGFGKKAGTAGSGTPVFWAPIENAPAKGKKPAHFADPSTDGEASETFTNANCEETKFTNGTEKFPPKSTLDSWAAVTTATTEKHYTLCGLTYDLAFTSYKQAIGGTTEGEQKEDEAIGTSVRNYLQFELSETGVESGQALIHNFDYLKLTSKLDKTATKGAAEVF